MSLPTSSMHGLKFHMKGQIIHKRRRGFHHVIARLILMNLRTGPVRMHHKSTTSAHPNRFRRSGSRQSNQEASLRSRCSNYVITPPLQVQSRQEEWNGRSSEGRRLVMIFLARQTCRHGFIGWYGYGYVLSHH